MGERPVAAQNQLERFDANKDKRLTGDERAKTERALLAGIDVRPDAPKPERAVATTAAPSTAPDTPKSEPPTAAPAKLEPTNHRVVVKLIRGEEAEGGDESPRE